MIAAVEPFEYWRFPSGQIPGKESTVNRRFEMYDDWQIVQSSAPLATATARKTERVPATVGIFLETEPWRLDANLESLRDDLTAGVELLLVEGPDAAMRQTLADQRRTAAPKDPSAVFYPPLVSCIMPTRGRREWVLRSVKYFERQDYPERELIILDDGDEDLSGQLPRSPQVRYLRQRQRCSIGAKRNLGAAEARGRILAHWDDDDGYAPGRLSAQVAPLVAGEAEITALTAGIFFDLNRWRFWRVTPELHRRLFLRDVHGGTLVYLRRVLKLARYPDRSLAEDAVFLRCATRRGARLARLDNDGLFVYLRHDTNSWSFRCGHHLDPLGWREVAEPRLPPEDRAFYAARSPAAATSATPTPR